MKSKLSLAGIFTAYKTRQTSIVELSGFEPKISEPKSDVLPLHHSSIKTGDSDAADFTIDDTLENSHE